MSTPPAPPTPAPVPPPPPPPAAPGASAAAGKTHRTGLAWLTVALVLAVVLAAYLWVTTTQWQRNAEEWKGEALRYGADVATLNQQLDGANAELSSARDQLAAATGRISELANEKAQLGDENVASRQHLDYQARVSEAAAKVAVSLGQCVDAQEQLIGYLEDAGAYDAADLSRFQDQVGALCAKASDANTSLQEELES
ncbi:hypothetical protein GCM10028784_17760 [Myceligenerans cantabricum]